MALALIFTVVFSQAARAQHTVFLQSQIDQAPDGGEIFLPAGTYEISQTLTIPGDKSIKITGQGGAATIVQTGNHRVLTIGLAGCAAPHSVTLENLVITDGKGVIQGGGIYAGENCNLTLRNSTVRDNAVALDEEVPDEAPAGGGIYFTGHTLELIDSTVSGNTATAVSPNALLNNPSDPPGMVTGFGGGIYFRGSTLTGTGATIAGNSVTATLWARGGGIYFDQGTVRLMDSIVGGSTPEDGNRAQSLGIDGYVGPEDDTLEMTLRRQAHGTGGGIDYVDGTLMLINSTVANNTAAGTRSDNRGGGIRMAFGHLIAINGDVSSNRSYSHGGGIFVEEGTAWLINSTLTKNKSFENQMSRGEGGAAHIFGLSQWVMLGGEVSDNVSPNPSTDLIDGAVYHQASQQRVPTTTFRGVTFARNVADNNAVNPHIGIRGQVSPDVHGNYWPDGDPPQVVGLVECGPPSGPLPACLTNLTVNFAGSGHGHIAFSRSGQPDLYPKIIEMLGTLESTYAIDVRLLVDPEDPAHQHLRSFLAVLDNELQVSSSNGPGPRDVALPSWMDVQMTAVPAPHSRFIGWDGQPGEPVRRLAVGSQPLQIAAEFTALQAEVDVPEAGVAGEPAEIVVTVRDSGGSPVTGIAGALSGSVSGANTAVLTFAEDPASPGTYRASYTPTVAGPDEVDINLDAVAVPGSPFTSQVSAGPPDVGLSTVTAMPDEGLVADGVEASTMAVTLRDAYGNPVPGQPVHLAVTAGDTGAGGLSAGPWVTDEDGRLTASLTSTKSGAVTVTAYVGSDESGPVIGTATIEFVPGPAALLLVVVQPADAVAGEPLAGLGGGFATVQVQDAHGNGVPGIQVTVALDTGAFAEGSVVQATSDSQGMAVFENLVLETAGRYRLIFSAAGLDDAQSAEFAVTAAPASAAHTTAQVPGGTAGDPTVIVVTVRDRFGNLVEDLDLALLAAAIGGANAGAPVDAIENTGNGTYTVTYTPTKAGTDEITIILGGVHIQGSPFTSTILAGPPSAIRIEIQPADTEAGQVIGGVDGDHPSVMVLDQEDNPVVDGTQVMVSLQEWNEEGDAWEPSSFDSGTTTRLTQGGLAQFDDLVVTAAGRYRLVFNVAGVASAVSAEFEVTPAPALAIKAVADVPDGTAGQPTEITIALVDEFDNPVEGAASLLTVAVTGGPNQGSAVTAISDEGDGIYKAAYTPIRAGTDEVTISLNGAGIQGSPFDSIVSPAEPDTGASTISADPAAITADGESTSQIVVTVKDRFDNPVGAGIPVHITTDAGSLSAGPWTTDAQGRVTATLTSTTTAGTATVTAYLGTGVDGVEIGSVVVAFQAGPISVGENGTFMSGQDLVRVADGLQAATITLQLRDQLGNDIAQGGVPVSFVTTLGDLSATAVMTDAGGRATVTLTSTMAGVAEVRGHVDLPGLGPVTNGSPVMVTFVPGGPDAGPSTVTASPDEDVVADGAGVSLITVTVVDAHQNPVPDVEVYVVSDIGSLAAGATDETDAGGRAVFELTSTTAGTATVTAYLGSDDSGSLIGTVAVQFVAGPAASLAVVEQPAGTVASAPVAGVDGGFPAVQVVDALGNGVPGVQVTVTLVGGDFAAGSPVQVVTGDDGRAVFDGLIIEVAGRYRLAFSAAAAGIAGVESAEFEVAPAEASPDHSTAHVPGGEAGQPTEITIEVRDEFGNPVAGAAPLLAVSVTDGPNQGAAVSAVTDNGDGTYTVTYTPTKSGTDQIAVALNGVPIQGSPFSSTVLAGPPVFINVEIEPTDAVAGTVIAGAGGGFPSVSVLDAEANPAVDGTQVTVALEAWNEGDGAWVPSSFAGGTVVRPTTDGLAVFDDLVVTNAGRYRLVFRVAEVETTSAEFDVTPAAAFAAHTTADVPAGASGQVTEITITVRDEFGNPVVDLDLALLSVAIGGTNAGVPVSDIVNQGGGLYSVTYTPTAAGVDEIAITLDGVPIQGSPYSSTVVAGSPVSMQIETEPAGGPAGSVIGGVGGGFPSVLVQDEAANPVEDGTPVTVALEAWNAAGGLWEPASFAAGTTVRPTAGGLAAFDDLVITRAGRYRLEFSVDGLTETSAEFEVTPAGPAAAETTVAISGGVAGEPMVITITVQDEFGNLVDDLDSVLLSVTIGGANSGAAVSPIENLGDGTFRATYTPTQVGVDQINITVDGDHIQGSPFFINVTPAPEAPANLVPPSISGLTAVGRQLTANPGTWSGHPAPAFLYEWLRCDPAGDNCVEIPGAAGSTYIVDDEDVGHTIRVRVTASNDEGSETVTSEATAVVTEEPMVDKSGLQALVDYANRLDEDNFTPASWSAVEAALDAAQQVLDDDDATQDEVDQAAQDLQDALAQLQRRAHTDVLRALVETAEGLDASDYTGDSWADLIDALDDARAILNDPDATQQEVDDAAADLAAALEGLELLDDDPDAVNKSLLEELVNQAKALDGNDYTTATWAEVLDAMDAGETVLDDPEATQAEVDAAVFRLLDALARLEHAVDVDKSKLQSLVNRARRLNRSRYTSTSWAAVQAALERALEVLADPLATQADVNDAYDELSWAMDQLVRRRRSTPAPPQPPASPPLDTRRNDQQEPFATGETDTSGDVPETYVTVNPEALHQLLDQEGTQSLSIHLHVGGNVHITGLTAADLKQIADQGADFDVFMDEAIYEVLSGEFNYDELSGMFGNAPLDEIAAEVVIEHAPASLVERARQTAQNMGYDLLVDPLAVTTVFTYEGQTVEGPRIKGGTSRKHIPLPDGVDPSQITTGVAIYPDGRIVHVPTVVVENEGRYYAVINDLAGHVVYGIIWNPYAFTDMEGHWAEDPVNEMGARLVVEGQGDDAFAPDAPISRKEFVAVLARGLGIMKQQWPAHPFPDVTPGGWEEGPVAMGHSYGLIEGFDDGLFHGDEPLTREQMMVALANTLCLLEGEDRRAALTQEEIAAALSAFADGDQVALWARPSVTCMVRRGIVQGDDMGRLQPKEYATRAESVVTVMRLLQKVGLIDRQEG